MPRSGIAWPSESASYGCTAPATASPLRCSSPVAVRSDWTSCSSTIRSLRSRRQSSPPSPLGGHSPGGVYVQRFAQRFPGEVVGLLLLDPAHEDWDLYQPEHLRLASNLSGEIELPALSDELLTQIRASFETMLAGFP